MSPPKPGGAPPISCRTCVHLIALNRANSETWVQERGMRLVYISVALFLVLGPVLAPPGHAQTEQERQWCSGRGTVSPDQQVSGCTAIIEAEHNDAVILATALNNRAAAYFSQGRLEEAIQDLNQAVKL